MVAYNFERENKFISDCSLERNINYFGHYIKPYPVTQPDAYACRNHCESREAPYFKYKIEKGRCYCKKTRGRRKRQHSTISGVAKGCGGGMYNYKF